MIEKHIRYTNSGLGKRILARWEIHRSKFVKVMPVDYKRVLQERSAGQTQPRDEPVEVLHG